MPYVLQAEKKMKSNKTKDADSQLYLRSYSTTEEASLTVKSPSS